MTAVLEVGEANDCEYAFLVGFRWSPTGQVIFGDTARSVVLTFAGDVVTLSE